MCELLVGLGDVEVLGVDDEAGGPLRVHVRRRAPRPVCEGCGGVLWSDGGREVDLVDLPAFGRPARLVWHKRRWRCAQQGCSAGTVTEQDPQIAPPREKLTARAGRWATRQAGRARPVDEVAAELGCSWHRVNASVRRWGSALLEADTERISQVEALGLDETLMGRRGRFRAKLWSTSIVDVGRGQLLDIVPGRTADGPTRWLMGRPRERLERIRWGVLDLSGPYRAAFDTAVPDAGQVADPFHVVRLGNTQMRRRRGKTDAVDAEAAARAVLCGEATAAPKSADGCVEAIRTLTVARRSAVKARTVAANQIDALVVTAPERLQRQLRALPKQRLINACARLRPDPPRGPVDAAAKLALRALARRHQALNCEIDTLDTELRRLCETANPALLGACGVGPETAATLLIAAGDNPHRMRSEASFASLCGTNPVEASSGPKVRHRLNRGGNRQANNALWRIAICCV